MTDTAPPAASLLLVAHRVREAAAESARREFGARIVEHGPEVDESLRAVRGLGAQALLTDNASVGHDHMNVAAVRTRGVAVTNAPDVLADLG